MKVATRIFGILICLALVPAVGLAQGQAKDTGEAPATHIRVDVLLTEFNGQHKVSSLPYTLYAKVPGEPRRNLGQSFFGHTSLRMGVRVPVATATGNSGGESYSYQNVGTNIDCYPSEEGGAYDVRVVIDRSSVYSPEPAASEAEGIKRSSGPLPVIRNFRADFNLKMRDGETAEGPTATDPFNGHVLKVSVTLHVIK